VVEDRREPDDQVAESRGIRFFIDGPTAAALGPVTIDLDGLDLVLRRS
jgi:hypothetical protein